jgi:hypothetical protein
MNQTQMGKPQITPSMLRSSKNISCDCGGLLFAEKLFFKKISAILSPSGKEEVAPMPVIVCERCGKVPSTFDTQNILPDEIRADKAVETTLNLMGIDAKELLTASDDGGVKIKGDLHVTGTVYSEEEVYVGTKEQIEEMKEKNNKS